MPNVYQVVRPVEFDDIIGPLVERAENQLHDWDLNNFGSETIDADPISNVDSSQIYFKICRDTQTDSINCLIRLCSLLFAFFKIKLSENERVRAIAISGTPGDGTTIALDIFSNSFQDIAEARNAHSDDILVTVCRYSSPRSL